jgi:hypothetical protein
MPSNVLVGWWNVLMILSPWGGSNFESKIDHLVFELGGQHIWARYKDHATSKASFVTWVVYAKAMAKVQSQCAYAIEKLIFELGNHFPFHELMDVLGGVYP